MRRFLASLLLCGAATISQAQPVTGIPAGTVLGNNGSASGPASPIPINTFSVSGANLFPALAQTGTWSPTGDAGVPIAASIIATVANSGGTSVWPASPPFYGLQTAITNTTSGVHLLGAGVGGTTSASVTQLKWIGGADPGVPLLGIGPTSGQGYSMDAQGFSIDGNSVGNVCIQVTQVSRSDFDMGATNCLKENIWFTTLASGGTNQSTQDNHSVKLYSKSTNSATGVLIDGSGTSWNVSLDTIQNIYVNYATGDGVVLCSFDNLYIDNVRGFGTATGTGRPFVVANSAYTPPSSVPCNSQIQSHMELKLGHTHVPVSVLGFQTGSSIVPNGGNCDMATKYSTANETAHKKLTVALRRLLALQGVDRRGNGYLKRRSTAHVFKAIDDVAELLLDVSDLLKPMRAGP